MNVFEHKSRVAFGVVMVVLSLLVLPVSGRAANVQVVCQGVVPPGAYSSVSAALSNLDPHGPNAITVSGPCADNIFIFQFDRLTIQSASGRSVGDCAPDLPVQWNPAEWAGFSRRINGGSPKSGIQRDYGQLHDAAELRGRFGYADGLDLGDGEQHDARQPRQRSIGGCWLQRDYGH